MGEVYLAQDTKLDRKVAIKILPADVAANRDRMGRFVREAKSAAALSATRLKPDDALTQERMKKVRFPQRI